MTRPNSGGICERRGCAASDNGPDAPPNRFFAYGVIARLALLAASLELERSAPDA